ncbi:MAG: hypothetical protein R3C69_03440 [Geminicoccaceae bacterium]
MGLIPTLLLAASGLTLCGWAAWLERRPRNLGELPLLPPVPVLILGVLVVLVSLAHLVSLWTGTPLKSRFLP